MARVTLAAGAAGALGGVGRAGVGVAAGVAEVAAMGVGSWAPGGCGAVDACGGSDVGSIAVALGPADGESTGSGADIDAGATGPADAESADSGAGTTTAVAVMDGRLTWGVAVGAGPPGLAIVGTSADLSGVVASALAVGAEVGEADGPPPASALQAASTKIIPATASVTDGPAHHFPMRTSCRNRLRKSTWQPATMCRSITPVGHGEPAITSCVSWIPPCESLLDARQRILDERVMKGIRRVTESWRSTPPVPSVTCAGAGAVAFSVSMSPSVVPA